MDNLTKRIIQPGKSEHVVTVVASFHSNICSLNRINRTVKDAKYLQRCEQFFATSLYVTTDKEIKRHLHTFRAFSCTIMLIIMYDILS